MKRPMGRYAGQVLAAALPVAGAHAQAAGGQGEDRGYSDGQKGLLYGSNGNLPDLHGGGLAAWRPT